MNNPFLLACEVAAEEVALAEPEAGAEGTD